MLKNKYQHFANQPRKKNSQEKFKRRQKKVRLHTLKGYNNKHFINKKEKKDRKRIIIKILIENILLNLIFKEL